MVSRYFNQYLTLSACAATLISSVPTVPGDNSHYKEGESRYIWMRDGDNVPRLVDLKEPADEQILGTRNGANNQYWLFTRYVTNKLWFLFKSK